MTALQLDKRTSIFNQLKISNNTHMLAQVTLLIECSLRIFIVQVC
jgi:hypothetical protein